MNMETYFAFVLFAILMTATPGMGNLTMMAIGQTTGFRSSLPFLAGAVLGATCLDTLVSVGLGGLFLRSPQLAIVVKCGGMAYILYLSWKIMTMQLSTHGSNKRFSFWEGLVLHPSNPKSWTMAVVGFSQVVNPEAPLLPQVVLFVATFSIFAMTFHSLWGVAGAMLMRTVTSPPLRIGLNLVMVGGMVGATLYAMLA
ncbi:LysE family translocator [Desulfovibrio inopinatus]|uniref:LysE family translocator n=1 Tax=Desulfovibrio inopinatus TaxID=102109 RepID=UPI0004149CEA|nr:LysE family translocator [Desulfovibrio inopinatus]